ncbi:MAG: UDP-N-acetylglucosamine 2-epimerase (hydrolyzing) [Alphaproteobacteria bacterium]|nr:UDP-N-acetylglucosamine 2-epimerase (hydrolyzing) [Alphaproteobacteria bacterium]
MAVRILSVTSSRADVGILLPVWEALAARHDIELHVLATGMHCAPDAPDPPIPAAAARHIGGADLGGGAGRDAASAMVACAQAVSDLLARMRFDCMLVIGDRLDMLPAAFAATPYNVPIAHLHGGELTLGAIDDRARHAMSKLSHLHFASGREAAVRLACMGEEPWRILVTGAPGLDTLARVPAMLAADFAAALSLPFADGFVLATVHPETNAPNSAAPMRAVLDALDASDAPILFTAPNSDPGGLALRAMIEAFLVDHPKAAFRETLGPVLYPNALRHAVVMLGNSSSGLIEAGFFGLPVIDVGGRQTGRGSGGNVRHVSADAAAVRAALEAVLRARARHARETPYGDGHAAPRIACALARLPERERLLRKSFHYGTTPSFEVPWESGGPAAGESDRGARAP